ncbi:hypothetical protein [uncultured Polaribacter sp.]|uniref:hypothetical protein n=1 Tax=uncultured Polaribacter sp. TaxID=174711 RepID=UPI002627E5B3|nr:hypothetical protein [uncultured Polaribacter sp.]
MKTIKILVVAATVAFTSCNTKNEKTNIELKDGTNVYYNAYAETALSIDGWNAFADANETLLGLDKKSYEISTERIENLDESITNLSGTIPASLKTEEVLEDISDVNEEYRKLVDELNEPQKNIKQNIEELVEKFDDLREELNETVEDYVS